MNILESEKNITTYETEITLGNIILVQNYVITFVAYFSIVFNFCILILKPGYKATCHFDITNIYLTNATKCIHVQRLNFTIYENAIEVS